MSIGKDVIIYTYVIGRKYDGIDREMMGVASDVIRGGILRFLKMYIIIVFHFFYVFLNLVYPYINIIFWVRRFVYFKCVRS